MEIKFRTVSPVILSGRSSFALYKGIDYEKVDSQEINIVYPFFSYENRNNKSDKIFEKAKSYYIPASSLKGSILVNKNDNKNKSKEENLFRQNTIFRDVLIKKEHIILNKLWKFQYLYQELKENNKENKKPKYEEFFPAVGVEMLNTGVDLVGNILIKDIEKNLKEKFEKRLNETCCLTDNKLIKYLSEIDDRIQKIKDLKIVEEDRKNTIKELEDIKNAISKLRKSGKKYIFLGGYKGLIGSLIKIEGKNIRNGFYIDKETMLPYGLVEVIKY
ncbi:RAMP superfamily CRISPR-associated protein [Peptostreptococcus canis]|uniref:CRISPR type III A-associated protein Csm5 n=1 Tax=Peptostreptococcus canis TaxID=1159213 RepID=A0ABR6TLJ1_9FIRM|nr:RAMP superfamily CRISPR-associated protein [Peptostreptococcus canis]MBC2576270.1 hypothetical protein [Peptostreptococcus canis]MBP1998193.1 hypothetical protein [Peptostreptococcus canis]